MFHRIKTVDWKSRGVGIIRWQIILIPVNADVKLFQKELEKKGWEVIAFTENSEGLPAFHVEMDSVSYKTKIKNQIMEYHAFEVPDTISAKDFVNQKLVEGYTLHSLYCEKLKNDKIKCQTYTLPVEVNLNNFIDNLENDSWKIYRFNMYDAVNNKEVTKNVPYKIPLERGG